MEPSLSFNRPQALRPWDFDARRTILMFKMRRWPRPHGGRGHPIFFDEGDSMNKTALALTVWAAMGGQAAAQPMGTVEQLRRMRGDGPVIIVPDIGRGRVQYHPDRPNPDDGREEAARQCQNADFDSDKTKCIQVVSRGNYFDRAAARACGALSFSSEVPACMEAIRDKDYLEAEVHTCASNSFGSGTISCFRSGGRPARTWPPYDPRPDTDSHIIRGLRQIDRELRNGDVTNALFHLSDLIRYIEWGMR